MSVMYCLTAHEQVMWNFRLLLLLLLVLPVFCSWPVFWNLSLSNISRKRTVGVTWSGLLCRSLEWQFVIMDSGFVHHIPNKGECGHWYCAVSGKVLN